MTPDWMQQAACKSKPPQWFTAEASPLDRDAARTVCSGCPVTDRCLAHAVKHGESGTWGGVLLRRGAPARRVS